MGGERQEPRRDQAGGERQESRRDQAGGERQESRQDQVGGEGQETRRDQAGGEGQEIVAFQRPEDSGSQSLMEKLVMRGRAMAEAPRDYTYAEMGELLDALGSYDNTGNALGYSVYYYARNMYQVPGLRFMAVNGVMPSSETIRDGSYPYVSDFYVAIRKDEPKDSPASRLFRWLTSDDGQSLINGLGYVAMKDSQGALPSRLTEDQNEPAGQIDLKEGYVILADGESVFGERGLAFFDGQMRLLHFIPNFTLATDGFVDWRDRHSTVHPVDELIPLEDFSDHRPDADSVGLTGLYSYEDKDWVYEPRYRLDMGDDGYLLTQWKEDGDRQEIYVDKKGRILYEGEAARDHLSDKANSLEWRESIAKKAMKDWNVPEGSIRYVDGYELGLLYVVALDGDKLHYYDVDGNYIITLDKPEGAGEDVYQDFRPYGMEDWDRVYVTFWERKKDGQVTEHFYLYRDGVLEREIPLEDGQWPTVIENEYYVIHDTNYTYYYTYKGELCGKFFVPRED